MSDVVFLDTSVLCCVLDVPGKNSGRAPIVERFTKLVETPGITLILPAAVIVETGNHIAQLADGVVRRDRALRLDRIMNESASSSPPWVVNNSKWDSDFLLAISAGDLRAAVPSWIDSAVRAIGVGDLSICHEMASYRAIVGFPSARQIRLWTLDVALIAIVGAY